MMTTLVLLAAVAAVPDVGAMPDFSFAGYRRGEAAIPTAPVVASVADFGAKGDDDVDDTAAFKAAIEKTGKGAILIPAGRYIVSDILEIRKAGVVLRGEGAEKTTLFFPKFLNDVRPNWGATTGGQRTSNYSWAGGFIWIKGDYGSKVLAELSPAKRGEKMVVVSKAAGVEGLKVGQSVDVTVSDDPENSLAAHLYDGDPGNMSKLLGTTKASLVARIVAIEGNRVTLDRGLRFDLESRWKPMLKAFEPTVTECGLEGMTFEFPNIPYGGHFTELGHNPIAIERAVDCWVKDVVFRNVDSGPMVAGRFCTLENLTWYSDRAPAGKGTDLVNGHHGLYFYDDDNVFTQFRFNQRFVHDITVSHAAGNVISNGSGIDLCFDHHKRASYSNLWTNIDLGAGTRPWRSGGGADLGKNSAGQETFWGLKAEKEIAPPPASFGPKTIHFVPAAPEGVSNLHEYQVKERLKGQR